MKPTLYALQLQDGTWVSSLTPQGFKTTQRRYNAIQFDSYDKADRLMRLWCDMAKDKGINIRIFKHKGGQDFYRIRVAYIKGAQGWRAIKGYAQDRTRSPWFANKEHAEQLLLHWKKEDGVINA